MWRFQITERGDDKTGDLAMVRIAQKSRAVVGIGVATQSMEKPWRVL